MESLGCSVVRGDRWVEVVGGPLHEGDVFFDMGNMPDMVPTLAVLAAFREGQTTITNVSHLRVKESDRIVALVSELKEDRCGCKRNGGRPHCRRRETAWRPY